MAKLDLGAVWADAVAIGRENSALIAPLAGMFLLLPVLIADQIIAPPTAIDPAMATEVLMERLADFARENWLALLIRGIVTSVGSLAILALVLRPDRPTVAEAMRLSVHVLPIYILANLLQSLAIFSGVMLFIVPGVYLIGRLMLVTAVAAAEGAAHPLAPLTRSVLLTHRQGWKVVILIGVIFVVGMVISIVLTSLTGTLFTLLLPVSIAQILQTLVAGLAETLLAVAITLTSAALYRALTLPAPRPWLG